MAGWMSNSAKLNPKAVDGNEMFMGLTKTAGLDLLQNCDLPPPMKVFTGCADKTVVSSMRGICSMLAPEDHENRDELNDIYRGDGDRGYDKLELLKALRLSQTRAREAEKKAEKLVKEKDCLSNALLSEARELFAYRQLVRLLELEVSKLHSQCAEQDNQTGGCGCDNWIVALALCLGIAGVGYALNC